MPRGKFDSTNQGHYPDLGSETSSAVPDPDLEIRGEGGHPDPQFGLTIRGGRPPWAPLLDPLLISIKFLCSFLRRHLGGGETSASVANCRLFSQAKSNTG